MRSLTTAFRTLTILPAPGKDTENFANSLYWFPVVGLTIGALLYLLVSELFFFTGKPWHEGAAGLIVFLSVILTRGLHLDGLSDWADGVWGGTTREGILAIMKDSAIGTFGAAALILDLLAKWILVTRLLATQQTVWIIVACVISRSMQAILAASFPYARIEGGKAGSFVQGAGKSHIAAAFFTATALIIAVNIKYMSLTITAFVIAILITSLFGKWSKRIIGGITGDVIGSLNELVEICVLTIGAIAAG